jgi:hypothetical protein
MVRPMSATPLESTSAPLTDPNGPSPRITMDPTPTTRPATSTSAAPMPTAEPSTQASAESDVRTQGGALFARDRAHLPERCVACGDTLQLVRLQTLPGGVRYFVCREHLIGAVAKLLGGVVVGLLALWQLASPVLEGRLPRFTSIVLFMPLLGAGVVLLLWAVPLHAGRLHSGWRRLFGAHRSLTRDPKV